MSFADVMDQDRRLVVLKALQAAAGYRAAQFVLQRYAAQFGHAVSVDRIKTDLSWLREQGLITLETPEQVMVATLTQAGLDVAAGLSTVPGVTRPAPGG
jgi:hypothetical protein